MQTYATDRLNHSLCYEALDLTTTGATTVALRKGALYSNTTAANNTAVGFASLSENTTGEESVAVGYDALFSNTTGSENTAVGMEALEANTTGVQNTALGTDAGKNIITGSYNITIGYKAGSDDVEITTGQQNTVIGAYADTGASDAIQVNIIGYNVTGAQGYTTVGVGTDDIRAAHGTASWGTVSDERVKKDIADATVGLAFINDLRTVTFN